MRTQLDERHLPRFLTLSGEEAGFLWTSIQARWPGDLPGEPAAEPSILFAMCQRHGLDHARVVLSLAQDPSERSRAVIEKLVGRPIRPWAESVLAENPPPPVKPAPPPPMEAVDRRVVQNVRLENPHREGTEAYDQYAMWTVGKTIAELLHKGMTRRAVRRGLRNGWVEVE